MPATSVFPQTQTFYFLFYYRQGMADIKGLRAKMYWQGKNLTEKNQLFFFFNVLTK